MALCLTLKSSSFLIIDENVASDPGLYKRAGIGQIIQMAAEEFKTTVLLKLSDTWNTFLTDITNEHHFDSNQRF